MTKQYPECAPIVVAATGGSGTRIMHDLLEKSGVYMGIRQSPSGDAHAFVPFLEAYIPRLLERTGSAVYRRGDIGEDFWEEITGAMAKALKGHLSKKPAGTRDWGWKNPRALYFLPVIRQICPNFRFIHMIRDGRSMALSANQNQMRKYFYHLFNRAIADIGEDSCRMWSLVNCSIQDWAMAEIPEQYFTVRFEDLCKAPAKTCGSIADALSITISKEAIDLVKTPPSVERWKDAAPETLRRLEVSGLAGLTRFGYLT